MNDHNKILDSRGQPIEQRRRWYKTSSLWKRYGLAAFALFAVVGGLAGNLNNIAKFWKTATVRDSEAPGEENTAGEISGIGPQSLPPKPESGGEPEHQLKTGEEAEAFIKIHKFTDAETFNQLIADLTISTKNAGPIVIRRISLHFCQDFDFQEPPICTPLVPWQEIDHVIIQNNKPFHRTILFGAGTEEIRSALSGYVNIGIDPTIYMEYTTNTGIDRVLNERIGTIKIFPGYSGFLGSFIANPIRLEL